MSKKKQPKDPYAKREAAKYNKPIASRELIMQVLEEAGATLDREQIAQILKIRSDEDREALRRRLRAMERDGQLIYTRRGQYGLASKMDLIRGRVIAHPDGFGFLVPDEGGDDVFLSARQMRPLLHGDRAVVSVTGVDRRGRKEGVVVEVLEHVNKEIVGRLFIESGIAFLSPDNKRISQDILIPQEYLDEYRDKVKHGQIIVVEIVEQPTRNRQPIGRIKEILGEHMAPGMEIDIAIRAHCIPQVWPMDVEKEIVEFTPKVAEADKQGRVDIRDLPLVTIDGEDARDFDDAVYCEKQGSGWRLLVAIADVSHYVQVNSALDKEAKERGNSVYFPERVVPMLPEILSNGLCSLNPQVDRLCMVCDMSLDAKGKLTGYKFYPAVMYSHARLTYNKVAAMLVDGDKALRQEYQSLFPHLENMYSLFRIMRNRREHRGAIDFDTTETKIVFGEERKIEKIVPLVRNDAHKLIEEFMIIANVATAKYLTKNKIPALYRIHDGPKEEKLIALREFLSEFGLKLHGGDKPEPMHFAELLKEIEQRPDAHLIQTVMLRSLQQAVYSPDNIGHFGLAFDHYAHFTSPIRRYPDLLVHRAIKHVLSKKKKTDFTYNHDDMLTLGEHCSVTERRADEATRDAVDWLKCEYMMDKVGEDFVGTISSVTSFGLFVELDDIYVEGLVHVTSLDNDYYHFDPAHHRLIGERTNKMYRLGDRIHITVASVNLDDRKIDFLLSGEQGELAQSNLEKLKQYSNRISSKNTAKKKSKKKKGKFGKKKTAKKKVSKKKTRKKGGKKGKKKTVRKNQE
ncbi:MAG: ribonuclease R [Thioalkalispiraceae bacterium]|jgi:ribonuclease R